METLISEDVWNTVGPLLETRGGVVQAAIAYLGADAPKILRLEAQDTLVFDGSDANLVAGAVNPDAVGAYLTAGCRCFSLPGLHAKMLVSSDPPMALVGSANLSRHSRDHLAEAVIQTDNPDVMEAVAAQIRLWSRDGTPVDDTWVARARTLYRESPPGAPRREPTPEPRRARLWVTVQNSTSRELPEAVSAAEAAAWQGMPRGLNRVRSLELNPGEDQVVREGDVMVSVWTPGGDVTPRGNRKVEPWAIVDTVVPGEPTRGVPPYAVLVSNSTAPPPDGQGNQGRVRAARHDGGLVRGDTVRAGSLHQ